MKFSLLLLLIIFLLFNPKVFADSPESLETPSIEPIVTDSPSPTILPVNTPSPTPFPTNIPSTTPTPTPGPDLNLSPFAISNVPSSTDSNQSFSVLVQINHLQANTNFFLKGAFYKDGSTNYFGQTNINGNWVKNSATAASQLPITTNSAGNWVGTLTVMPDSSDTGFTGADNYQFKVGRYNSSGSDLNWSNSAAIYINYTAPASPTPSASPADDSIAATVLSSPNPSSTFGSVTNNDDDFLPPQIASIEGIATVSASSSKNQNPQLTLTGTKTGINWYLVGGGVGALLISCFPLLKFTNIKLRFVDRIPHWDKFKNLKNLIQV